LFGVLSPPPALDYLNARFFKLQIPIKIMTIVIIMRRDSEYAYPCRNVATAVGIGLACADAKGREELQVLEGECLLWYISISWHQQPFISGVLFKSPCKQEVEHTCSTGTLWSHALYTTRELIPLPEYVGPTKVLVLDDFNTILKKQS
jgi:hypothetical protein